MQQAGGNDGQKILASSPCDDLGGGNLAIPAARNDDGNLGNGNGNSGVDGERLAGGTVSRAEHSVRPKTQPKTEHSVQIEPCKKPASNLVDFTAVRAKLSTQSGAVYDRQKWKRSRVKSGWMIKRLTGYTIAETEYGVSYLSVVSRKPDRTSADNSVYPLAGYFNWKSLEASGLIRKERKNDKRDKTAAG